MLPRVAAADDCLTGPTGDKADGQHWRYRLERGRRCWYLKDSAAANAADSAARQTSQAPPSAWDFAQPAPPKLTPRRATGPSPRVGAEALADDGSSAAAKPQPATPSLVRTQPPSSFDDSLQRNAPTPSWQPLDSADMDAPAAAPAASASAPPDEPAPAFDPAASTAPADTPGATPAKSAKPVAPVRKLLMVVVGALSLSGLLASALYRLSKVGRRRRRNRNWQREIKRVRRNRDKSRSKSKVVHAKGRSSGAVKRPKTAPETTPKTAPKPAPAPASKQAPPTPVVAVEPQPAKPEPAVSKPAIAPMPAAADPAAELVDLLATRVAKVAPLPQVPVTTPRPAPPLPKAAAPAPAALDPAAELVDLLGSHAAKRAAQLPVAEVAQAPASLPPPEPTPLRLPIVADPAAELANLLESRFAPPPPSAKTVTAPARPQPPAASINTAAPKTVDPIAALANLLEAKESERAARFGNADALHRNSPPPAIPPELAATVKPVDPAVELFDMLHARAARTPPLPQGSAPEPVKAVQPSEPVKPAQPDRAMAPRRMKVAPPVRIDSAQVRRVQAAPEPIAPAVTPPRVELAKPDRHEVDRSNAGRPRSGAPKVTMPKIEMPKTATLKTATLKAAAPKTGKSAHRTTDEAAPRRKGTKQPPLPPALMLEPENDGPTPPLDFIPRPQALRPRMRDISQDESLDGVQDILARLAKQG